MRVISWNVFGGRYYDQLCQHLLHSGADVMCLQEMFSFYTGSDKLHRIPEKDHQIVANLFEILEKLLPEYRGWFAPATMKYTNDGNKVSEAVQYGDAVFVHRSIPVPHIKTAFVHGEFSGLREPPKPRPRAAIGMRVYNEKLDCEVAITSMHGLWTPEGKRDTLERSGQSGAFHVLVQETSRHHRIPSIACGDFNILPRNPFFRYFRDYMYRELVTENGYKSTRTPLYRSHNDPKVPKFADYMLVNNYLGVKSFEVMDLGEYPGSDHAPLVLEF